MADANASMLALLVAQAEGQGADLVTLRALIEEASEVGRGAGAGRAGAQGRQCRARHGRAARIAAGLARRQEIGVERGGDLGGQDLPRRAGRRHGGQDGPVRAGPAVRFAGYAAIFGRPDRGGDIVRAGAFARIAEARRGGGAAALAARAGAADRADRISEGGQARAQGDRAAVRRRGRARGGGAC